MHNSTHRGTLWKLRLALVLTIIAIASATVALVVAQTALPLPGMGSGGTDVVTEVLPGGPAWRAGIRVGQLIVAIDPGERPEDWVMTTVLRGSSGPRGYTLRMSALILDLRETVPVAVAAFVLGVLALLLLRFDPATSAASAVVGIALVEQPLMASGDAILSTVAALTAVIAPAIWPTAWWHGPRWLKAFLLGAALVCAGAWAIARFLAADQFSVAESARIVVTYGLVLLVIVLVLRNALARFDRTYDVRRTSDLAVIVVAAAIGALLLAVGEPVTLVALGAAVPLLGYPVVRRRLGLAVDRIVLGNVRERAAAHAIEEERGRIARELHDDPIQQLAAVLRRIESRPDTAVEGRMLRDVSDQLRRLTTELRPPMIDDLGLGPSLMFLVDQARPGTDIELQAAIDDHTNPLPPTRPPIDVELAGFRVAQEAIANAVRHSRATRIVVRASITADAVEVSVRDDGIGLDRGAAREAALGGHIGLASMGDRAAMVNAELVIEAANPGTIIRFAWHR